MKNARFTAVTLALAAQATLLAGHALAANTPNTRSGLTREQVRAELMQARAAGDYVVDAETGLKAYQANPGQFPARQAAKSTLTREQVRAKYFKARAAGDFVVDPETGLKAYEANPGLYPIVR